MGADEAGAAGHEVMSHAHYLSNIVPESGRLAARGSGQAEREIRAFERTARDLLPCDWSPVSSETEKVPPQPAVSRILSAFARRPFGRALRRDDHSSSPVITDGIKQPTRKPRTGRPMSARCQATALPYLALLRAGFCLPPVLPRARCALTAPFHPCLFAAGGKPATPVSGMFSVPLSFELPRPGVTRRTALRSSDFPPRRLTPRRSSGLLRRRI